MDSIIQKVLEDRSINSHTNSAHPIGAEEVSETLITQLQATFPDCRVYVETMVNGIHDKKTYIERRVRRDLKCTVENPRLCVVVDWSSL